MCLNIFSNPALNISYVFLEIPEVACSSKETVRREIELKIESTRK